VVIHVVYKSSGTSTSTGLPISLTSHEMPTDEA